MAKIDINDSCTVDVFEHDEYPNSIQIHAGSDYDDYTANIKTRDELDQLIEALNSFRETLPSN